MKPKPGEIVLVDFGSEYGGHRQIGVRPAIVLHVIAQLAIVVPLTSNLKAQRFKGTVVLQPSKMNNLSKPSVVLAFQIQPIDVSEIIRRIGMLQRSEKRRLNDVIRGIVSL